MAREVPARIGPGRPGESAVLAGSGTLKRWGDRVPVEGTEHEGEKFADVKLAGADLAESVLAEMASSFHKWTVDSTAGFKRTQTRVLRERSGFLPIVHTGSTNPVDVYDQLFSAEVGHRRKVHQSRLSQKLAGEGNERKRKTLEEEEEHQIQSDHFRMDGICKPSSRRSDFCDGQSGKNLEEEWRQS